MRRAAFQKGICAEALTQDYGAFKESQYDLLAEKVRKSIGYGTDLPDDGEAGGRQMSNQYVLPGEIEKRSFEILTKELGDRKLYRKTSRLSNG